MPPRASPQEIVGRGVDVEALSFLGLDLSFGDVPGICSTGALGGICPLSNKQLGKNRLPMGESLKAADAFFFFFS